MNHIHPLIRHLFTALALLTAFQVVGADLSGPHGLAWATTHNSFPVNLHSFDRTSGNAVDASGNVIVTGASFSVSGSYDFHTAKYAAADGALLWENRYDGPSHSEDKATAIAVDGSGNVFITGNSFTITDTFSGTGNQDICTLKFSGSTGDLLWEKRHNGTGDGNDLRKLASTYKSPQATG